MAERDLPGHGNTKRLAPLRRVASALAFIAAGGAIVWMLDGRWQEIAQLLDGPDPWMILWSVLLGIAMVSFSGVTLAVLAVPSCNKLSGLWGIARIYLVAQVLKYLPGRIWALAYQLVKVKEHTGGRMALAASLTQLFLSTFVSLVLFGAVTQPGPVLWAIAIPVVALWIWRGGTARYLQVATDRHWASASLVSRVLALLVLEWLAFVAIAWMVCAAIGSAEHFSVPLVAFYAVSWVVGSAAMLTPGGLVVREGGFMWLCQMSGISLEFAAAFALLARVVFTASELAAAIIAGVIRPRALAG